MVYTSVENIHKVIDPLFLGVLTRRVGEILKQTDLLTPDGVRDSENVSGVSREQIRLLKTKTLFNDGKSMVVPNRSPYLAPVPDVFVVAAKDAAARFPKMNFGNQPRDGGHFILASKAKTTNGYAKVPHLFAQITQPESVPFLLVPRVSAERRRYIPISYMDADVVASDAVQIVPNATMNHFGVLASSAHMAWMRTVAGRVEMRYRVQR